MRILHARTAFTLLAFAATATVIAGCSSDEGTGPVDPPPPALLGTWVATSIMVGGEDAVDQGMNLSFHFAADGEYSYLVGGDLLGFCDGAPTCDDWGEYTATANSITFDPGETYELTLSYTISGNTLTASGTFDTAVVTITFQGA